MQNAKGNEIVDTFKDYLKNCGSDYKNFTNPSDCLEKKVRRRLNRKSFFGRWYGGISQGTGGNNNGSGSGPGPGTGGGAGPGDGSGGGAFGGPGGAGGSAGGGGAGAGGGGAGGGGAGGGA